MRKIWQAIILSALIAAAPTTLVAETLGDGPESEVSTVSITVSGNSVRVCGANGETLDVFNLAGVKICSIRIDSADKTIRLTQGKGCYILKVGNTVRKVSIR